MSPVRILLADDDPDHRQLFASALRAGDPDAKLTVAASGQEVIDIASQRKKRPFDCIILDFHLSDYQAHEILRILSEQGCKSPAIVMSSSTAQQVVVHSMRNGCLDFINKQEALQPGQLWKRVSEAVTRYRSERAERRSEERRIHQLTQMAQTDALTGLANRRHLEEMLAGRREVFDRRGESSCVMFDVDHFKNINDTMGHPCGDEILKRVAAEIQAACGDAKIACRWGGEEFLVVLPDTPLAEAFLWAEALRCRVADKSIEWEGSQVSVTISGGVAAASSMAFDGAIVSQADQALYLAKSRGRNRIFAWPMVQVEITLADVEQFHYESCRQRLAAFMSGLDPVLGPVQREHMTSHSESVSRIAQQLACELGLDDDEVRRLQLASLCHDIGKALIPESILAKPARLSEQERRLVDRHAEDGAQIAQRLGADEETVNYIRHHHARYDGAGSPKSDIPCGARIINVADALAAMTSDRPHQPACSLPAAAREIHIDAGKQFDPDIADMVVRTILSGGRFTKPRAPVPARIGL